MLGERLADFRTAVPRMLFKVLGCTHLNDVLRNLADVPTLAARLQQALSAPTGHTRQTRLAQ
jgi:hypothetical protein